MSSKEILSRAVLPLVDWYAAHRREYPWRTDPTPYHVWLSEVMLQQTRIEAAMPYYRRFLEELPDVRALAAVDEDRLMKLWQGLGYYSRARNLKKAAEQIVAEYGGELPDTAALLKRLPGIGDYTAGAIASIAYGRPEPAVDGNVLRVLSRLLADGSDVTDPKTKKQAADGLREVYPSGREAALFTQGLMELGETVCVPNATPRCEICPLAHLCKAKEAGNPQNYPVRSPKKERKKVELDVLILRHGDRIAIRKRPPEGLLSSLYEFPNLPATNDARILSDSLESLGVRARSIRRTVDATHLFTHVEWYMHGWEIDSENESDAFLWLSKDELLADYAIPSAFRAFIKIL